MFQEKCILYIMTIYVLNLNFDVSPANEDFAVQTIGLYSECNERKGENVTKLNSFARIIKWNVEMVSGPENRILEGSEMFNLTVHSFDVCENSTLMLEIITNLTLDEKYFFQETNKTYRTSSICAIFTYLTQNMSNIFNSLVHGLPIFYYNLGNVFDIEFGMSSSFLSEITELNKWKNLVLISIRSPLDFLYHEYYNVSIELFKRKRYCLHFKSVNSTNWKMTNDTEFTKLWFMSNKPTVILFGDPSRQIEFIAYNIDFFHNLDIQLIVHDLYDKYLKDIYSTYEQFPKVLVVYDFFRVIIKHLIRRYLAVSDSKKTAFELGFFSHTLTNYGRYIQQFTNEANFMVRRQKYANEKGFFKKRLMYLQSLTPKGTTMLFRKNRCDYFDITENISENKFVNHTAPSTECNISIFCRPGFHSKYGNVSNGFTWRCEPRQQNHYKSVYGDTGCSPCTGKLSISNKERTKCIDPYTRISRSELTGEKIFALTVSGVGMLMTLLTMTVFVRKRQTPIVKLSDFTLSVFHMGLNCFIFSTIYFWLLKQERGSGYCITKILLLSIAYVLSVGVLFCKSQKLLDAFLSKVRVTEEEMRRALILQVFTVVLFLILVNGSLAVVLIRHPINVLEVRDSSTLTKQLICNTHNHITIVISMTMVLQLMCSIQAFRGRHLPSVMNDGIVMTFTTFILTVVFAVSFVIVHFQKTVEHEVFYMGAVASNTLIISSLIYGLKAVRIVRYPYQNTKHYFREQTLIDLQDMARSKMDSFNDS